MKLFRCQVCDNIIYFENRTCGRCGYRLAYIPEGEIMAVRHRTLMVEGVQFHPESFLTEHGHALLRNFLQREAA